jgi:hypothetical protein
VANAAWRGFACKPWRRDRRRFGGKQCRRPLGGWANQTMELIELPRAGSPSAKKNLGKAVGKTTLAANEDHREFSQFRQVASGLPRSTKYRGVVAGRTNYTSGS